MAKKPPIPMVSDAADSHGEYAEFEDEEVNLFADDED